MDQRPIQRIERVFEILSCEEAEEADRRYWQNLTPEMRLQKLVELRELWIPPDDQRLKRIIEIIEIS